MMNAYTDVESDFEVINDWRHTPSRWSDSNDENRYVEQLLNGNSLTSITYPDSLPWHLGGRSAVDDAIFEQMRAILDQQVELSARQEKLDREFTDLRQWAETHPVGWVSLAPEEVAAFDRRMTHLEEAAQLPENWDGFGADPPTAAGVAQASRVMTAIAMAVQRPAGAPAGSFIPSAVYALPTGAIQLEWASGEVAIEVEFHGTREFAVLIDDMRQGESQYHERHGVAEAAMLEAVYAVLFQRMEAFLESTVGE